MDQLSPGQARIAPATLIDGLNNIDRALERLSKLQTQITLCADHLGGPIPRDASVKPQNAPTPLGNIVHGLQRRASELHDMIEACEVELARIANVLHD